MLPNIKKAGNLQLINIKQKLSLWEGEKQQQI